MALKSHELHAAKASLKGAGCPDDLVEKLVATPGMTPGILAQILAWIAANPTAVANIWALVQVLITALTPAA